MYVCRNENKQRDFDFKDKTMTFQWSKSCLDATSGNKIKEKNVAGNNPNGLAITVTQEIHACNLARDEAYA